MWEEQQKCMRRSPILFYALLGLAIVAELLVTNLFQKHFFRLTDGDLVHCTPIRSLVEKLPTPPTTWQTTPSMEPFDRSFHYVSSPMHSINQATQLIALAKQNCPIGTVPKRSRPGIIHFTRMVGRKAYPRVNSVVHLLIANYQAQNSTPPDSALQLLNDRDAHKYALTGAVGPYKGTQGRLSIWQPHVQDQDFSLAQVWVSSIDTNGKLHSLEAGWQVYRGLYSDSRPRLFVYWTADLYITTGCYNLQCPGFIQVSNKWLLGGSFAHISTFESDFQYEVKIGIFKDRGTGDWWLQLNDDNVGFWPRSLFGPGAFDGSNTRIQWGGEIWHRSGEFTDTHMGNGNHPSSSKHLRVAYVRNLQVVNRHDNLRDPPPTLSSIATYHACCDIRVHELGGNGSHRSTWGTYAYFGGPGFNSDCIGAKPFHQ